MPPKKGKGTKSKKKTARVPVQKPTPSDVESAEEEIEADDESKNIYTLFKIGLLLCHNHIELRLVQLD